MTDMDWAYKLAQGLVFNKVQIDFMEIAAQLRKAKADGRAEILKELGLRAGDTVTYGPTD